MAIGFVLIIMGILLAHVVTYTVSKRGWTKANPERIEFEKGRLLEVSQISFKGWNVQKSQKTFDDLILFQKQENKINFFVANPDKKILFQISGFILQDDEHKIENVEIGEDGKSLQINLLAKRPLRPLELIIGLLLSILFFGTGMWLFFVKK